MNKQNWYYNYLLSEFEKHLQIVNNDFQSLLKNNKNLVKTLNEYNSEEEIAKRDKQISKLKQHTIISTNDETAPILKNFIQKHHKKCKNNNHYIFDVIGTGLGNCISVICPVCNEDIDISNIG